MPVTEKTYPEWVQVHRKKGTTVKKKGDAYYLYKRTSKRVPGKKYPQPVDTYIGLITPDGVIESHKRKISLTDIEVWEYGYSKAVFDLCPSDWKKPLGSDWENVLKIIRTVCFSPCPMSRTGGGCDGQQRLCSSDGCCDALTVILLHAFECVAQS